MTCARSETWNFNVTKNRIICISNLYNILSIKFILNTRVKFILNADKIHTFKSGISLIAT